MDETLVKVKTCKFVALVKHL